MATAFLLPLPRQVFNDSNGDPLSGGFVHTYVPGGTTPKLTWQDEGETPNSNPIVLDGAGSAVIYGDGDYQFTTTDSLGNNVPAYSGLTQFTDNSVTPVEITMSNVGVVSDLRGATLDGRFVLWLEGYYAQGDGGEGMLWWNVGDTTSADNGGTIFVSADGKRWYRETMGQSYSVRWFGATGNGSTVDTAAIQNTLNWANGQGTRSIYFPAGNYLVSSPININNAPMEVFGHKYASTITTNSSTADIFDVSVGEVYIHDLQMSASVAKTAGAFISLNSSTFEIKISNCRFTNHSTGIGVTTGFISILDVDNCVFIDAVASIGIGILIEAGLEVRLRHILMNSGASPEPTGGIVIGNCGDVTMDDVNILQHDRGLLINPSTGQECDSVWALNSFFDHCGSYGVLMNTIGTGHIQRCRFVHCWMASSGTTGFLMTGATAGTIIGVDIIGCDILLNVAYGIEVDVGSDIKVDACRIGGNGQSGVVMSTNISNWTISSNTIGPAGGLGGNGAYGMFINTGCDHYVIMGNRLQGNGTGAINNGSGSAAHAIFDNGGGTFIGYNVAS